MAGREDVLDHRDARDVMQHLGARRLHARALARRQHDNVKVSMASWLPERVRSRTRAMVQDFRTRADIIALIWTPGVAVQRERRHRSPGGSKGIVVPERLEVGIAPGEGSVLWIESDRSLEVGDRFGVFPSLGMGHRQHVERVFVVGVLVANQTKVRDRLIVAAAVDRER